MLQLIFGGISQGCIYGLIALSFVLIYKATETISFAQGELMMVGAFGALLLTNFLGFSYGLAVLSAVAALALIGLLLERGFVGNNLCSSITISTRKIGPIQIF